jgi:hypothetical protein
MPARRTSPMSPDDRTAVATMVVQRGIVQAEERYLVDPGATLGIWFARVQETIAVGSRVTLRQIDEARQPDEDEVADEQLGVHADICAEAIRATAQVWGGGPSPLARVEILDLVSGRSHPIQQLTWLDLLVLLARCSASLEPLANGLREADVPMAEPTDCEVVADCFLNAALHAFGGVHVLC